MCFDNRKESFLCGTGTMFNQEILSCDHEAKVNCASSPQYYEANTELGKPGAEPGPGKFKINLKFQNNKLTKKTLHNIYYRQSTTSNRWERTKSGSKNTKTAIKR